LTKYYLFNIYLIGFLIFVTTYNISPDFGVRLSVYYTIVDCVLVGYMLTLINGWKNRIFIVTIFSAIAVYKLFGYMANDYYTYKSILLLMKIIVYFNSMAPAGGIERVISRFFSLNGIFWLNKESSFYSCHTS
jgi:hypothetical protein